MLSDWQVGRSHRERRNFPMGGSFYTSLSILEYLELQNSRAKNLSNTPFDKEETLNVWWETGCEHAWVHGYTENTLRATFRNILDNTGTNKQEQPSQTIQLKSEIHAQLLIQKWPKTGEWVCGGMGNAEPVTSTGGPAPHVHSPQWLGCWRSLWGLLVQSWNADSSLIAMVTTVTFQNLPQSVWGRGNPKSQI